MALPPPGYTDPVFEFGDVARILNVNATTLNTWLGFIKMLRPFGDKRGHRRVFSQHEVFVLALLVSIHHAGIPINAGAVSRIVTSSYTEDGPIVPTDDERLVVRKTDVAGIVIHAGRLWRQTHEILKELELG